MGDTDFSDDILSAPILAINDETHHRSTKGDLRAKGKKAIVANNEAQLPPRNS